MHTVLQCLTNGTRVAELLPEHRRWLQQGFDDEAFFLVGGIPNVGGGAILAAGLSPAELAARVAKDPFVVHGVVTPEVIEIEATMNDSRLAFLAG
jgi:uncharacterized protein YciI